MKLKKWMVVCFLFWVAGLFFVIPGFCITDVCPPFYLRTDTNEIINPITGVNADQPYSTRQTCGACHDVDTISKGYHFNMDWDKADDDLFKDTDTPWLVSTGLTGNMTPYGYFFLAKKKNSHPDEIDLTAFDFIARAPEKFKGFQKPGCAACHPGGGMLETDRDGMRYDKRLAKNPELANSLDGDYYQSQWDKSGVIEPDCFICHSNRYMIQPRITQMKNLNFKWASVVASGIGQVHGSVADGEVPRVVYNKRLFNEDGKFILPDMVFKPKTKNCLMCHESIELGKRGNSWDDPVNPDVHHQAGLTCIDCHASDINHNFAKGNALANKVAPELNNSMRSCRDCHTQGYKGATRMKHRGIRKDHLDKLSCEACHIPELQRSAVGAMYVNTGRFGKIGQLDTNRFGEHKPWKPAYVIREKDADKKSRITPVNPFYTSLFTNKQENGTFTPLFLSEVEKAYTLCQDKMSKRKIPSDFHDPENVSLMLRTLTQTLEGNHRFDQVSPHFHDAGTLYALDKNLSLSAQKDTTWVSCIPYFSISHNVTSIETALGKGGCKDCHSKTAHLFNGRVVTNFFGRDGNPVTVSMSQFLNLKAGAHKWNTIVGSWINFLLPVLLMIGVIIVLILVCKNAIGHGVSGPLSGSSSLIFPGIGILLILLAGHLLLTKELGVLITVLDKGLQLSSVFAVVLLLVFGGLYGYLTIKKINSKSGRIGFALFGILTVGTGLVLWLTPGVADGFLIPISIVHAIFAICTISGFAYLLQKKCPQKPGDN